MSEKIYAYDPVEVLENAQPLVKCLNAHHHAHKLRLCIK